MLCRELDAGKMLGILVAEDAEGTGHTLYAFSGQLGDLGFHHPDFVGPIFDYLQPDGYFKTREREISRQNEEITLFEEGYLARVRGEYREAEATLQAEVTSYREECLRAKRERKARRETGVADENELAEMIRRSQFEKAELHRLKKRTAEALAPLAGRVRVAESQLAMMREKRRRDSEALQGWLFDNFNLLNALGETRTLREIFADTPMRVAPSGAGECCAPKLLHAAYKRGWHPVEIAEYWYGSPKKGEVRHHGAHYPACRGKCLPVLTWMLRGLDVTPPLGEEMTPDRTLTPKLLFENKWFCVISKPSGLLSVPGKGNAPSAQRWLEEYYGPQKEVKVAHRLDQDTSGLLIATFGREAYKVMQSLFAGRQVRKTYVALLEGDFEALGAGRSGRIVLPLSADILDRPRQRVDYETGKEAVTEYEFTDTADGRSRVELHPLTGRTHQLRVHMAAGLGMPIVGDRLYGNRRSAGGERLRLHARSVEFRFPPDGRDYRFETEDPF